MNSGYSATEVEGIRSLVLQNDEPDDSSLLNIIQHDLNETKTLIKRYLRSIKDEQVSIDNLCSLFNSNNDSVIDTSNLSSNPQPNNNTSNNYNQQSPRRSPRLAPRPIDVTRNGNPDRVPPAPLSASSLALPPKYRGKSMPKTPHPVSQPFSNQLPNSLTNPLTSSLNNPMNSFTQGSNMVNINSLSNLSNINNINSLNNISNINSLNNISGINSSMPPFSLNDNVMTTSSILNNSKNLLSGGVQARIPVLPKIESSPAAIHRHQKNRVEPEIGSLAAVLHPSLGPAHVCRVLGQKNQNRAHCYLVAFFQSEYSPCFVPSEYLFQLKSNIGFPLGNEEEFRKEMANEEVSVDFLLERIFSSAQNLVINHAEVLFPPDKLEDANFKPEPQQVQQIMFQCVSCAALLLVCYVSCEWQISPNKLNTILSTIMKTNPSKFASTQNIMNKIQESLLRLLSMIENK
ncbi:hypothetical protein TRFO_16830 [Tritrichomonas foetus]|uniref:Uncharacterized protein n=1 Tax=Tritrichomonas foetus TaxID=1144522 RepID=A0A1J4KPD4_9EUKA|nr:hypothetical protein TRFO_16830 [Tritrichomonas foetus]|eukprot:OHT13161.1 hypothetical protein TRFO_16830 [Tritrichomonas foetus]